MFTTLSTSIFLLVTSTCMMWVTWRRCGYRNIVLTPYVLACGFLALFGWTGQVHAITTDYTQSVYPSLVLFCGIIAFLGGFKLFSKLQTLPIEHYLKPLVADRRHRYFVGAWALLLLMLLLGTYRFQGLPPVTRVLQALCTSESDVTELAQFSKETRLSLTSGHWTMDMPYRGQGIIGRLLRVGFPYLFCVCLGMYFKNRSRPWFFFTGLVAVLTLLYVGGDATRSPIANAGIVVLVFVSYIKSISYRHLAIACTGILLLLVIMTVTSSKGISAIADGDRVSDTVNQVVLRLGANSLDDVAVIEFITDGRLEYHFGALFLEHLLAPIPGMCMNAIPFDLRLYHLMDPYSNSHVFASTTLLGLIYTEGGVIAVVLIYFLIGLVVGKTQVGLFSGDKEVASMAKKAVTICAIGRVMLAGILFVAVDLLLIVIVHKVFCFCSIRKGAIAR
ncbi:MAG: hypothetical protein ACYC0X_22785 [Pirellulaceae bacterium]